MIAQYSQVKININIMLMLHHSRGSHDNGGDDGLDSLTLGDRETRLLSHQVTVTGDMVVQGRRSREVTVPGVVYLSCNKGDDLTGSHYDFKGTGTWFLTAIS